MHCIIILLIVIRSCIIKPLLILKIPTNCLLDAFLELERWLPTELLLQLCRINGITRIMTQTVGNVCDEIKIFTLGDDPRY